MRARSRHIGLICIDAVMAVAALGGALWLRFDGNIPVQYSAQWTTAVPLFVAVRLASFALFRTYSSLWRYATMREAVTAAAAVGFGSVVLFSVATLTSLVVLPRSVYAIEALLFVLLAGAPRVVVRWRRGRLQSATRREVREEGVRTLIVGAGDAGAMLVREFEQQPEQNIRVVGLVDDDVTKINREIGGVKVLGSREEIPDIVARENVERVIIAMPSVDADVIRETMALCRPTGVELKMLPPLTQLMSNRVTAQDVRNVEIEDLLRREPVETDLSAISAYLRGKRVLVTGAGGSIGSELCRQVCTFEPAELIMLDHSENSVFEIDGELREKYAGDMLTPVIGDIRHRDKMERLFARRRPHVVFHAAAHKHVPLMESHPDEAVANNVLGTRNVAEAAAAYGAERFVMVSTDKAVNPGNVMGATKRMAELVVQAMQSRQREVVSNGVGGEAATAEAATAEAATAGTATAGTATAGTRFVSVRFGNVLGSRGSVIPKFRTQIEQGGPVTVTHPDMTRYFMTIPEAVQLILQAAAMGEGGEVFVLDMGEPVRIADLAHDLIRLSGFEPGKDIPIVYTGVRPGEKLFEELVNDSETVRDTSHDKIMMLNGEPVNADRVAETVAAFEALLEELAAKATGGARETADGLGVSDEAGIADGAADLDGANRMKRLVAVLYDAVDGRPVDDGEERSAADAVDEAAAGVLQAAAARENRLP